MELKLVVKLDQYAGNVDEVVCQSLINMGMGRHGSEEGERLFKENVEPLCDDGYLPAEFSEFLTDYGSSPYSLDDLDCNSLNFGVFTDEKSITETIDVWKRAYGQGNLPLELTYNVRDYSTPDGTKEHTVKILGFGLIEIKEIRKPL